MALLLWLHWQVDDADVLWLAPSQQQQSFSRQQRSISDSAAMQ